MTREISAGDFERVFAVHFAHQITRGSPCSEELVRACFKKTVLELGRDELKSDELWIKNDVATLMENSERIAAATSEKEARAIVFELLFVH